MIADLITWLRAQLDEDERLAHWANADSDAWWFNTPDEESGAEHLIAEFKPARVLREVEAKRRILGDDLDGAALYAMHERGAWPEEVSRWADEVLRLLALPYADRDGYRPEWAPPNG